MGIIVRNTSTSFETGSLIGLKLTDQIRLPGQEAAWTLLLSVHHHAQNFHVGFGSQTQVLMPVRQALY